MHNFTFIQPRTLPEALSYLAQSDDDICIFGGGSAMLLAMRQRMLMPRTVIALDAIPDLKGISYSPVEGLRIGAMCRHDEIASHPDVQLHYPLLALVFGNLANPQVRNQGTIGGNLCYADPTTDPPAPLWALDAEVSIATVLGQRRMAMKRFLVDFFTTALEPGEILVDIRLPAPKPAREAHYRRHLRTLAEHRPFGNAALAFTRAGDSWQDVRLVIGAAVPVAQEMTRAQQILGAGPVTPARAAQAAQAVAEDMNAITDQRGDAAFRRQIMRTITRRMICDAAGLNWKDQEL